MICFTILTWSIRLPINVYNIFGIHQKYGLNNQTILSFLFDYIIFVILECVKFILAVPLVLSVIEISGHDVRLWLSILVVTLVTFE